jgi:cell wall-associated NlpC family hydrolase
MSETRREVAWMLAPLRRAPRGDAALDTEAIRGEAVVVLGEAEEGWVPARLAADGYEGYLPEDALTGEGTPATHVVTAARTLAYPAPDFKRPPVAALTMGARVRVLYVDGRYAVTDRQEYLIARHIAPADHIETDRVALAERFLGTPYLWGGKSAMGIDCSGLVQLACGMAGIAAPRDSGPQEKALGEALPPETAPDALRRGDLLFWPGHVAIARGDGTMIHANAHHMMVAVEPIAEALTRIEAAGDRLRTVRRLPG